MLDTPPILIVDDEPKVREMLAEYLTAQGCHVLTADGGAAMRQVMATHNIAVVVLDVSMPDEDGLSLTRFLRAHYPVGIILLTAAHEVYEGIIGLEIGADDYLAKPFDPRELLARIKSVSRRLVMGPRHDAGAVATAMTVPQEHMIFGRYRLDLATHTLHTEAGSDVPITSMEFDLLKAFVTHPNRALSRDQLLDIAHQRDWEPLDRSIDIRVARLRRKIEDNPAKPQTIKTVRGIGYMFVPSMAAWRRGISYRSSRGMRR